MKRFCALLVLLGVDQALSVLNVVYCSCAVISKYDIGGTTATVNLTIYNTKKDATPENSLNSFARIKIVSPIGSLSERPQEHPSDGG